MTGIWILCVLFLKNFCKSKIIKKQTNNKKKKKRTSKVVQWLGIHLSRQGTGVPFLLWEDPTCLKSNEAHAPQLLSLCSKAHVPQLLTPSHLELVLRNKSSHCNEQPVHRNEE